MATAKPARKAAAKKPAKPALTPWQKWKADEEAALEDLCDRILAGETITSVAKALEISKGNLIRWLGLDPDRSARAREARAQAAATYDDLALQQLEQAADPFQLARAREVAQHLRWRASKVNPGEYGEKLDIKQQTTVQTLTDEQLDAELARVREKLASVTSAGA